MRIKHLSASSRTSRGTHIQIAIVTCAMTSDISAQPEYTNLNRTFAVSISLRKHAYSNELKILQRKKENCHKKSDIFHISAQNIDCGYSLEPPR